MPKYLLEVSYTAEGAKGLMKDGGSKRQQAARTLIESLGGKMEAFYFAFGEKRGGDQQSHRAAHAGRDRSAVKKSGSYTPPGR